jgi:hypothetical protein
MRMASFRVSESGASEEHTVTGRISIKNDNSIGKRTSRFLSKKTGRDHFIIPPL